VEICYKISAVNEIYTLHIPISRKEAFLETKDIYRENVPIVRHFSVREKEDGHDCGEWSEI
jgi:hypothetical protein